MQVCCKCMAEVRSFWPTYRRTKDSKIGPWNGMLNPVCARFGYPGHPLCFFHWKNCYLSKRTSRRSADQLADTRAIHETQSKTVGKFGVWIVELIYCISGPIPDMLLPQNSFGNETESIHNTAPPVVNWAMLFQTAIDVCMISVWNAEYK